MSSSSKNFQPSSSITSENKSQSALAASSPRIISPQSVKHITPAEYLSLGRESTGHIASFFLKLAALETIRRFSRSKCPFVWHTVQALQVLGYPPFKWIQRWTPLGFVVKGIQKFSRPLLFLSVTTALTDHSRESRHCDKAVVSEDDPRPNSESPTSSSVPDIGTSDDVANDIEPENWLLELFRELEKQGITLPERINKDELHRFYIAANGDLSCLLSSLKRTVHWRDTFHMLSPPELEMWSHLVFWHGCDMMLRPCLIIRLGLACSSLVPKDRARFAQALVSQIENGVLHFINEEDPRITVLMDCQGLSPFRFPMQLLRSFSAIVQDNYPNRLGTLFVVRLPPVVRVIFQAFIQVLKPTTRQKLRVEGEAYQKVLAEVVQALPAFLGGDCRCSQCRKLPGEFEDRSEEATKSRQPHQNELDDEAADTSCLNDAEAPFVESCGNVLRPVVLALLVLWVFIVFFAGLNDPESISPP